MEFKVSTKALKKQETQCLVLSLGPGAKPGPRTAAVDKACGGALTRVLDAGDFNGKAGSSLVLRDLKGLKAERVLLLGAGEASDRTPSGYQKLLTTAARTLQNLSVTEASFALEDAVVDRQDAYWRARALVESLSAALYRFEDFKSRKADPLALREVHLLVDDDEPKVAEVAIREGAAIANGVKVARDLGNLPGNVCTPTYLAAKAREMGVANDRLEVSILEEDSLRELGMNTLLSVSSGSAEPARLIVMEYRGAPKKNTRPQVLVGKGITFDSGGISLKAGAQMDEMKFDMCGAASVFGALTTALELELPINLVAVVAAAENMPDGQASRPGDIVTSLSGQTVEILNTDAEGRLVLCDALTWVEGFKPAAVVDIATLTGACIMALGHQANGLMSNDPKLAKRLRKAGEYSHDRAWELPLWDEYQSQLDSNFADMQNIGGRPAGTITAGCFLSRFAKAYSWAHLDIAGTAWHSGKEKGATGRCVPLLAQYLLDRAQ